MKRNIKSIQLVFENCEVSQKLTCNDVSVLHIRDIKTEIQLAGFDSIAEYKNAKSIEIVLRKSANINIPDGLYGDKTLFERLETYSDITALMLEYENGDTDEIYVKWDDENEYENSYQDAIILNDGSMLISIKKNNDIDKLFEKYDCF